MLPKAMARIIDDPAGLKALLTATRRIAVLGIKTEAQGGQAAFYVPEYLQQAGFEIIPVPVYFPEVTQILGQPVYRTLAAVPPPVDMVNVFRRSHDVAPHLADILAARPSSVWMQLGIADSRVAEALVAGGIDVVMNRCLMVDHQHLLG
jgi:predicted CoA-binding protein